MNTNAVNLFTVCIYIYVSTHNMKTNRGFYSENNLRDWHNINMYMYKENKGIFSTIRNLNVKGLTDSKIVDVVVSFHNIFL